MRKRREARACIFISFIIIGCFFSFGLKAQLNGTVRDSITKNPLAYVTVAYEGKGVGTLTDDSGAYTIPALRDKPELTFTAIGYKTKKVAFTPGQTLRLDVVLASSDVLLEEVVVEKQKEKYSRKDNPAVELMKKVIAHKNFQNPENSDYYQYEKYQKITASLNDIKPEEMNKGLYKKMPFLIDRMEVCPIKNKLIIPISVQETVSQTVYRKDPKSEKTIVRGIHSSGVQELFSTGEGVSTMLSDVFSDINIYDNDIRLLQTRFVSPISDHSISFYQYFLLEPEKVENDSCYHLFFRPNNPQDFGFIGHLYVLKDSTYTVKKCMMNLPLKTAVNFVEDLDIIQSYERLEDGRWVLKDDEMVAEIYILKELQGFQVRRTTRYDQYSFDKISPHLFKMKGNVVQDVDAMMRNDAFWDTVRPEPLTAGESDMNSLLGQLKDVPGFKTVILVLKALVENYVETGTEKSPSKFDFGPVNSFVGHNKIEGWRAKIGGQTTANLHPHLFLGGYYAYGFRDEKLKYQGEVEYSFNKKEYLNREFPKHYIALSHSYDLMSVSDQFLRTSKDNVFVGFKTGNVDQMSYVRESVFKYEQETYSGFSYSFSLKNKNDRPAGSLAYIRNDAANTWVRDITTSEAQLNLRYAPGETFINTKQRRVPVNLDAPVFTLSHTVGLDHFLGSEYRFHFTQVGLFKRFWLSSWGKFDVDLKASKQWSKVPFPLLITPETNLSYIIQKGTYNLVNNLEFLGDQYASMELTYNMNGKLFNRIPVVKNLKWREVLKFRAFTGSLSDQNDPAKTEGLFYFPVRNGEPVSFAMQHKPYMEASFGIHNIFKLIHVEYVRRLNYLDNPDVSKHGFRIAAVMQF